MSLLRSEVTAAKAKVDALERLLQSHYPAIWDKVPAETYMANYLHDRRRPYNVVPQGLERAAQVIGEASRAAAYLYNRYALLRLLSAFALRDTIFEIPQSIIELYPAQLARILSQTESFDDEFYDLANDLFLKDLGILTHRLIPVGPVFVDGWGRVPRSVFFKDGLGQLLKASWFIPRRCGGFAYYFAAHVHTLVLDEFHAEGYERAYRRIAALLELNRDMKGFLGASWLSDPQLDAISPHLAFFRELPLANGAALFFLEKDRSGSSGALTASRTRRRLFERGEYVPAIYMRVWPRAALIEWSRRTLDPPSPESMPQARR